MEFSINSIRKTDQGALILNPFKNYQESIKQSLEFI
jgi:hypothetical protein